VFSSNHQLHKLPYAEHYVKFSSQKIEISSNENLLSFYHSVKHHTSEVSYLSSRFVKFKRQKGRTEATDHLIFDCCTYVLRGSDDDNICETKPLKHQLQLRVPPVITGGTGWRSWLRHCATSRTPGGVTGIFHWLNPCDHIMAQKWTQPLAEMSTRITFWG